MAYTEYIIGIAKYIIAIIYIGLPKSRKACFGSEYKMVFTHEISIVLKFYTHSEQHTSKLTACLVAIDCRA